MDVAGLLFGLMGVGAAIGGFAVFTFFLMYFKGLKWMRYAHMMAEAERSGKSLAMIWGSDGVLRLRWVEIDRVPTIFKVALDKKTVLRFTVEKQDIGNNCATLETTSTKVFLFTDFFAQPLNYSDLVELELLNRYVYDPEKKQKIPALVAFVKNAYGRDPQTVEEAVAILQQESMQNNALPIYMEGGKAVPLYLLSGARPDLHAFTPAALTTEATAEYLATTQAGSSMQVSKKIDMIKWLLLGGILLLVALVAIMLISNLLGAKAPQVPTFHG